MSAETKTHPIGQNLLVRVHSEEKKAGDIIIVSTNDAFLQGVVVDISPSLASVAPINDGLIHIGTTIMFHRYEKELVALGEDEYIVPLAAVAAVVDPETSETGSENLDGFFSIPAWTDFIRISLIILFAVTAWRIAWSNFSLDLTKFDFSDLLAMILALFAMAMSVAFYFKSTDSSNQFYDNIYNFTQKTSEILGRIEERFGERLKHLDEGYGRLQSHFA